MKICYNISSFANKIIVFLLIILFLSVIFFKHKENINVKQAKDKSFRRVLDS